MKIRKIEMVKPSGTLIRYSDTNHKVLQVTFDNKNVWIPTTKEVLQLLDGFIKTMLFNYNHDTYAKMYKNED